VHTFQRIGNRSGRELINRHPANTHCAAIGGEFEVTKVNG
jgi:hypothetical protein